MLPAFAVHPCEARQRLHRALMLFERNQGTTLSFESGAWGAIAVLQTKLPLRLAKSLSQSRRC
jgi:hypothetical protein